MKERDDVSGVCVQPVSQWRYFVVFIRTHTADSRRPPDTRVGTIKLTTVCHCHRRKSVIIYVDNILFLGGLFDALSCCVH